MLWLVSPDPTLVMAEALVRSERYLRAIELLRPPSSTDPAARRLLGRALAGAGRCEEALPVLAEVRSGEWTATDAYFEGTCRERVGDTAGARAAWSEAVAVDPEHAWSWYRLARSADAAGEHPLADEARDRLWTLEAGPLLVVLADARRAVLAGDPDADLLLAELVGGGGDPRVVGEVALLDGRRWLDLGWPEAAIDALNRAARARPSDPEVAVWLGRAWLAAGDSGRAAAALGRPWLVVQDPTPELLALRAELEAR